jgi:hypothetical protein
MHQHDPFGGSVCLTGVAKRTGDDPCQRQIEVGVLKNDDRIDITVFAHKANIARVRLTTCASNISMQTADPYGANRWMIDQSCASFVACAVYQVHHAGGCAGIGEAANQPLCSFRRCQRRFHDDVCQ